MIASGRAAGWRCSLVAAAITVLGASAAAGGTETNSPALPLEGEHVGCLLFSVGTYPKGASNEMSSAGGAVAYVQAGRVGDDPAEGLCSGGSGGGGRLSPDRFKDALYTWVAECRLVRADMDDIELEVDWQRLDAVPGGEPVRAAGDRRTIRLREGQHHWIDFVDDPAADGHCPRSIIVGVRAFVEEDPGLEDRTIRYDLWFVDEGPAGTRLARHQAVTGTQGERVKVAFEPLRWAIPGARFADGSGAEVVAEISAEVLGRVRRDGSVALIMDVSRWLGVAHEAEPRSGGIGDGGRKGFLVNPGESVALELPNPEGGSLEWSKGLAYGHKLWHENTPGTTILPHGVSKRDVGVRVNFAEFFRGHTMRLIVTATAE